MMLESWEGFADNPDAVHAELERQLSRRPLSRRQLSRPQLSRPQLSRPQLSRPQLSRRQLSSRNPRRAAVREQTPLNNHGGGLEHYRQSQDASQGSELSFDYNQVSFAQVLQMLDSDPVSLGNSQELTLGLAQEGPATPGFTNRLWLSLDDSQESDAGVEENGFL